MNSFVVFPAFETQTFLQHTVIALVGVWS